MAKKFAIPSNALQVVFGLLLGVAVLGQSSFAYPTPAVSSDEVEQEQSEEVPTGSISVAKALPNSTSQVNLTFDSYLLEEVSFSEEEENVPVVEIVATRVHKAIRILLSRIVAPNAP